MIRRLSLARGCRGYSTTECEKLRRRIARSAGRIGRSCKPQVGLLEDRCLPSATIINLGSPPDASGYTPTALNDLDQVIGTDSNGDNYLYSDGTWDEYVFSSNLASVTYIALNDDADATGSYVLNLPLGTSATYGARYADGMGESLSPNDVAPYVPGGGLFFGGSETSGINSVGVSVGLAYGYPVSPDGSQITGPFEQNATVWEPGEQNPTFLPIPGSNSAAAAINDSGAIVGTYTPDSGSPTPFLFQNGVLTNLPMLPDSAVERSSGDQ